jgi:dCMP deaminase
MFKSLDKKIKEELKKQQENSLCLRRKVSAVIVKNKKIISSGYNGNSNKIPPCSKIGCAKNYFKIRDGKKNELCTGICAEQRAMFNAYKKKKSLINAIIYTSYFPCTVCSRLIVESGIKEVHYFKDYRDSLSKQILKLGNIKIIKEKNQ